jgi:hypothetical protein
MYYLLGALAAVIIFAFSRANSISKSRSKTSLCISEHLHEELLMLDRITVSAARDSSGAVLDHSDQSIVTLEDLLIAKQSVPLHTAEEIIAVGGYLGEVLVRNHAGVWMNEEASHPLPFIVFPNGVRASSFDLVQSQAVTETRILAQGYATLLEIVHGREVAPTTQHDETQEGNA